MLGHRKEMGVPKIYLNLVKLESLWKSFLSKSFE